MSINAYQNQLEDIDNRILDLLERHKLISKMIKKIEKKTGQNVLTKENEDKNLNRLKLKTRGLKDNEINAIYGAIFSMGKSTKSGVSGESNASYH